MATLTYLFSFILVLMLFVFGGLIVAEQLRGDLMGNYAFLWRNVSDGTNLTASGIINLSTQRVSDNFDANLTVTFYAAGCNDSDVVRADGTFIGNLSGASPKVITFDGSLLVVPIPISYTLNNAACEIDVTYLDYHSWDGCNFDADTCDTMVPSFAIAGALMRVAPFLLFMVMLLPLFFGLLSLAGVR